MHDAGEQPTCRGYYPPSTRESVPAGDQSSCWLLGPWAMNSTPRLHVPRTSTTMLCSLTCLASRDFMLHPTPQRYNYNNGAYGGQMGTKGRGRELLANAVIAVPLGCDGCHLNLHPGLQVHCDFFRCNSPLYILPLLQWE
jgi:hypothetical protein